MQEAILTGESMPSHKSADDVLAAALALADRTNMVYKATMVATGRARAVVVATGDATEVGRINVLIRRAPEPRTPLERRLDALGRQLIWLTLAACGVVAAVFLLRGLPWRAALETGLALAVAAVPEGLPAIATIAMAVGVWRMARRRVVVRRLPVVETLGAATVICTDKTGTLTTGEMTATALWVDAREYAITGVGHAAAGAILFDGAPVDGRDDPLVLAALRIAALANRGELVHTSGTSRAHGDPTDVALLVAAEKGRVSRSEWRSQWPEIGELPFSSERKMMATVHRGPEGEVIALMKGAPMTLLARSARILTGSGIRPLDDAARNAVQDANAHFASRGLRVLALAYASDGDAPPNRARERSDPLAILEDELIFVGLIGMEDAPVPGIESVVSHLRAAGLRTIMLTGDQRLTAVSIATRIGILAAGEESLDGESIAAIPTRELAQRLGRVTVVSRVSPADKLRVVHALQEAGEIVAMIGDGVNDAPALKSADIGIAMGIRGTDVAKEAAAMVLQDDRLETVDAAIEEGRVIFDNIQKAVLFLFSCNIAEVLVLLLAGVLGLPLPLAPLQILWLNLVTDTLPAIALALEPAERHLMQRAPASPKTRILSASLLRSVFAYGALITASTLAAFWWATTRAEDPAHASTIAWMTLAFSQLFHVGNVRSRDAVRTMRRALQNPYAIAAVAAGVGLQLSAIGIAPIARALGVQALTQLEWLVVVSLFTRARAARPGVEAVASRAPTFFRSSRMIDSTTGRDSAESFEAGRIHRSRPTCIVVPLDGSAMAERALPVAITIAGATGAEVRAVHVYVPLPRGTNVHGTFEYAASVEARLEHDAAAYARDVRKRYPGQSDAEPAIHVDRARARPLTSPFGEAPRTVAALERYARRHEASMFVMTTHGRGGFSRAWIGNVADSLIRGIGVPVLIVRPDDARATTGTFQNIIVAVDGSELAERVIPAAMGVAADSGARLTLVRVITVRAAVARSPPSRT